MMVTGVELKMKRLLGLSLVCACVLTGVVGVVGVDAANADEPWWHLRSMATPTYLNSGVARDEVQEIKVAANGGSVVVEEESKFAIFKYDATHREVQTALEGIYGARAVEVSGGPGDATGSAPYVVTFKGKLADRPLPLMNVAESKRSGGLQGEAVVSEATRGRGDATISIVATNFGDAPVQAAADPVTIAQTLPAGVEAVSISGLSDTGHGSRERGKVECVQPAGPCTYEGTLPAYEELEVAVEVVVEAGARSGVEEVGITGGGAPSVSIDSQLAVNEGVTPPGVHEYSVTAEEEGGLPDRQAGSHPLQLTTSLFFNRVFNRYGEPEPAGGLVKDLHFELPPGLIGNPTAFPKCTLPQFNFKERSESYLDIIRDGCPADTMVGMAVITVSISSGYPVKFITPVYSIEPARGEPARFAFDAPLKGGPVFLDTSLRTGGDYGVTVTVPDITEQADFLANEVTFWGVPADERHDADRGELCLFETNEPLPEIEILHREMGEDQERCAPPSQLHPSPLLTLPTSCESPLQTTVQMDSWDDPGSFLASENTEPAVTLDGCNRLPFGASIEVAPDEADASTPSGLSVGIHVPQEEALDATGLSPADVRTTTVALPPGVAVNPAGGDGLLSCSEAEIGLSTDALPSCPDGAKIATVELKTPLLPNKLTGEVYLAAQEQNPFSSLLAMYLVAYDPVSGSLVKVAGEVNLDPITGQLVSTFANTPQLPFEDLKLHFFGGDRAPLATPGACGAYTTTASFVPWSANPPVESESTFDIDKGPNGASCSSLGSFDPSLTGGTTSIQAGGFSPFTMTMSREDGEQSLQAVDLHMPAGLSGLLSGVELCPEPQADEGTCGPNSQIGETTVGVGVGGDPYTVKGGKVYITGPYKGAPFGLSIVNPAKAGPFDLEDTSKNHPSCDCLVVRAKIEVDPTTAELTVTTDNEGPYKIPTILEGIPLEIKRVNVTINRPGFTFNPTNCEPMHITGTLHSAEGASDGLSVPFQATNCATLGFKPQFKVSTSGKTTRQGGASLHVDLVYPKAPFGSQANVKSVKVDLPRQLPSRLTTLQKACVDRVFEANPAACPSESKVGTAKAITPLVPVPLEGPAYFVSHGGAKFPELIVVLQGYGVTIDLHGETFISEAGITSSTFHTIPDQPVGSFELTLPQGSDSALAANGNLCAITKTVTVKKKETVKVKGHKRTVTRKVKQIEPSSLVMPTLFVAQNGATIKQNTPIEVTGCGKTKKKAKTRRR